MPKRSRHIMEPDPDIEGPSLVTILWLYALILGLVVGVAIIAQHS